MRAPVPSTRAKATAVPFAPSAPGRPGVPSFPCRPCRPCRPCTPCSPCGPFGNCPALKSSAFSEPSLTLDEITASFFSCLVPTLFFCSVPRAYPVPPIANTSAINDATLENVTCLRIRSIGSPSSRVALVNPGWRYQRERLRANLNGRSGLGEGRLLRLVLRRRFRTKPICQLRRPLEYRREAHNGHELVERHLAPVDLLEEVHRLVHAPELRVVVLDVARREVRHPLHVDSVDHGVEDLLARRVLEADRDQHDLSLLVLGALVAEADRGCLTASLQLVYEDRRVEVEDVHGGGDYLSAVQRDSAASAISRSPL